MKPAQNSLPEKFSIISANIKDKSVTLECSLDGQELTFADLDQISKYYGTKSIDIGHSVYREGCDTCDYGAEEIVSVHIKNITKNL